MPTAVDPIRSRNGKHGIVDGTSAAGSVLGIVDWRHWDNEAQV
jgi:hypothetical protein